MGSESEVLTRRADRATRDSRAIEATDNEHDPEKRQALLTSVLVGGGQTGVELVGAIAEQACQWQTSNEDVSNNEQHQA